MKIIHSFYVFIFLMEIGFGSELTPNTKDYPTIDNTMSLIDLSNIKSANAFKKEVKSYGGREEFVFKKNNLFSQVHASTVVQADDGTIVVAWFGGTHEKAADVGIWSSFYKNGKWSQAQRVAKINNIAHWNPILFKDENGMIYLFFKVGADISWWQTYLLISKNGIEWSQPPKQLIKSDYGGRGPVKNHPIILSNGVWVAPASVETYGWKSFVDISEDKGKTWNKSSFFDGRIVQNEVAKSYYKAGYRHILTHKSYFSL